MSKIVKLAFLNNFRRKNRTILALLGIFIGIAALIVLVSVVDGTYKQISDTLGRMQGLIVYKADAVSPAFDTLSTTYEARLSSIPGVKYVIPELLHVIGTIDNKSTTIQGPTNSLRVVSVEPDQLQYSFYGGIIYDKISKGSLLKNNDKKYVVVSKKIADDYHKTIGSTINIDGKDFTIKGIFESDSQISNQVVLMLPDAYRDLYDISKDRVNYFTVVPTNPADAKKISKIIDFKFKDDLQALGQQEMLEQVGSILDNLKLLVVVVSIVSAVVAGIGVLNTMLMSVMERFKEIGTLKAVGWTKENVIYMIVLESVFIGIMGGILGLIGGYLGAWLLTYFVGLQTYITISLVLESAIFAFSLGLIGGLYPAWVASKLDPIQALRDE